MATKNHKHSMSQPERAFWREVFLLPLHYYPSTVVQQVQERAALADLAVEEYRKRVTWRQS